jgi:hypothetical protein
MREARPCQEGRSGEWGVATFWAPSLISFVLSCPPLEAPAGKQEGAGSCHRDLPGIILQLVPGRRCDLGILWWREAGADIAIWETASLVQAPLEHSTPALGGSS